MQLGMSLRKICESCHQPIPDPTLVIQVGPLVLQPVKGLVYLDGKELTLTPTERRLILLLGVNLDTLVTWADLYENCVADDLDPKYYKQQKHTVRVHLSRLRAKLGPGVTSYMKSVPGPIEEGGVILQTTVTDPSGASLEEPAECPQDDPTGATAVAG